MRKLLFGLLSAAFVVILPFNGYSSSVTGEELKLYLGQPEIIEVSSPKRIAIGNPAVADIANITKSELTINPKTKGDTTLVIWDDFGEQSYTLRVFTEDMSNIKRRIDNILSSLNMPGIKTKAEDEEDRVVLLGSVKFASDKEKVATALAPLKNKILDLISIREEEAVIEIDVQVLELNRGSQDTLGLTWPSSINLTEVGSPAISAAGTTWGKLFRVVDITREAFTLKLDALIQEGKARILSRPRLSCQSGKEAKLVVGGEVPVLSGTVTPNSSSSTGVGATSNGQVEYKEYGVILNIKPRLEESGRIHLNLDVEVSEVGDMISTSYALAYTMTKRTATTELFLDDGQTMALGGLIKKRTNEDVKRLPWLSDIPVLGAIFRQRTTQTGWTSDTDKINDTELFIMLTPHLVDQGNKTDKDEKKVKASRKILPPAPSEDLKDPVLRYSKMVQKRILENIIYPAEAKAAGFYGTVKLSLKLSPQGDLRYSKVKESSGYRILDDAALKAAQKISPYPPFPAEIKKKEIWVDVPIIYQLE
ncbi:MAG: TonB family protein [Candidatus Omnitrophica bacterium]|jgi:pilus assembly protein CpaC|nr:TonB family protein [Candidatus Omnitrophota bacterium]